jgi:hypothetical protein
MVVLKKWLAYSGSICLINVSHHCQKSWILLASSVSCLPYSSALRRYGPQMWMHFCQIAQGTILEDSTLKFKIRLWIQILNAVNCYISYLADIMIWQFVEEVPFLCLLSSVSSGWVRQKEGCSLMCRSCSRSNGLTVEHVWFVEVGQSRVQFPMNSLIFQFT